MKNTKEAIRYYLRNGKNLVLIFVLLVICSVIEYLQPLFVGQLVDGLASLDTCVKGNFLLIIFTMLANVVFSLLFSLCAAQYNLCVEKHFKHDIADSIAEMGYRKFQQYSPGELIERIDRDSNIVVQAMYKVVFGCLNTIVDIAVLLFLSLSLNYELTMVVLISIPILLGGQYFIGKLVKSETVRYKKTREDYLSVMQSTFGAYKAERILGCYKRLFWRLKESVDSLSSSAFRRFTISRSSSMYSSCVNICVYAAILYIASELIIDNSLSVGDFITFNSYSSSLFSGFLGLVDLHLNMQSAIVSIDRLFHFYNDQMKASENEIKMEPIQSIQIRDVSIELSGKDVIKGASLDLRTGHIYCLTGPSGSGKTTLLETLYGINTNYCGTIFINETLNHKEISENFFQTHFSYVFQPPYTVKGSMRSNIQISGCESNDVSLDSKLMRELLLDDSDMQYEDFSFGQKQRIAFIRGVRKKADVYLFDEITNGVEQELKEIMLRKIVELSKHAIVIVASHDSIVTDYATDEIRISKNGYVWQDKINTPE